MQFELSEEQQELTSFLRDLFDQRSGSAEMRKTIEGDSPYDAGLWSVLCEQIGAASLAIPEEFGGAGFTTRETHIVLEELGRALTPSPFLGSVAIAAQAILEAGAKMNSDASERLLPGIAAGETIATLAWATPEGNWDPVNAAAQATQAASGGADWELNGTVPLVLDGTYADVVLVIAQTPNGPALFELRDTSTLQVEATPALDQTLNLATLTFEDTAATLLSTPSDHELLETIYNHALTAVTATQVGTASRGLEMTVEYSKQRSQFGRLIGSFQALKHRMADMHVLLETARTTSGAAAWAEVNHSDDWSELTALAKATCSDALSHIAGEAIQLHGGIAITWEHDAHFVFKRAHATAQLFGTAREQRSRLADALRLVST